MSLNTEYYGTKWWNFLLCLSKSRSMKSPTLLSVSLEPPFPHWTQDSLIYIMYTS